MVDTPAGDSALLTIVAAKVGGDLELLGAVNGLVHLGPELSVAGSMLVNSIHGGAGAFFEATNVTVGGNVFLSPQWVADDDDGEENRDEEVAGDTDPGLKGAAGLTPAPDFEGSDNRSDGAPFGVSLHSFEARNIMVVSDVYQVAEVTLSDVKCGELVVSAQQAGTEVPRPLRAAAVGGEVGLLVVPPKAEHLPPLRAAMNWKIDRLMGSIAVDPKNARDWLDTVDLARSADDESFLVLYCLRNHGPSFAGSTRTTGNRWTRGGCGTRGPAEPTATARPRPGWSRRCTGSPPGTATTRSSRWPGWSCCSWPRSRSLRQSMTNYDPHDPGHRRPRVPGH